MTSFDYLRSNVYIGKYFKACFAAHKHIQIKEIILSSILFWLEIVDSKLHTNDYIISCTSFIHFQVLLTNNKNKRIYKLYEM